MNKIIANDLETDIVNKSIVIEYIVNNIVNVDCSVTFGMTNIGID